MHAVYSKVWYNTYCWIVQQEDFTFSGSFKAVMYVTYVQRWRDAWIQEIIRTSAYNKRQLSVFWRNRHLIKSGGTAELFKRLLKLKKSAQLFIWGSSCGISSTLCTCLYVSLSNSCLFAMQQKKLLIVTNASARMFKMFSKAEVGNIWKSS